MKAIHYYYYIQTEGQLHIMFYKDDLWIHLLDLNRNIHKTYQKNNEFCYS